MEGLVGGLGIVLEEGDGGYGAMGEDGGGVAQGGMLENGLQVLEGGGVFPVGHAEIGPLPMDEDGLGKVGIIEEELLPMAIAGGGIVHEVAEVGQLEAHKSAEGGRIGIIGEPLFDELAGAG